MAFFLRNDSSLSSHKVCQKHKIHHWLSKQFFSLSILLLKFYHIYTDILGISKSNTNKDILIDLLRYFKSYLINYRLVAVEVHQHMNTEGY